MSDRRPRRGSGRGTAREAERASDRLTDFRIADAARWLAVFSLAALVVVATLVPSDSIAVEQGGALPLLPIASLAWVASLVAAAPRQSRLDLLFDALVWLIALWMWVATASVAGSGDVRAAINEAWWWTTAAAALTAARRSLATDRGGATLLVLLVALASALAVQAAHQQWITLPAERARYEAAPERVIEQFQQETGIAAPPGSPQRALFEGRLYGGGPTATFALQNSLAAYLLMGILLAGGVLIRLRRDRPGSVRIAIASSLAVVSCALALLWTASRSGLLAVVLTGGGVVAWSLLTRYATAGSRSEPTAARRSLSLPVAASIAALVIAGAAIGVFWLRPGWLGGEAFSGARRSLQYRLDYWRATLDMLADHPWFGAGPGNFQDRYATYRLDRASEGIADPHNWIMETWAAGGTPAVLLLAAAIASGCVILVRRPEWPRGGRTRQRWAVASGAAVGLAGVLVAWISQLYLPDVDALGLSIIAAVAMGVAFRSPGKGLRGRGPLEQVPPTTVRAIAGPAIVAVAVHLLAAGGWTVPGVAVPLLALVGLVLGPPQPREIDPMDRPAASRGPTASSPTARPRRWIAVGCGVAMLFAWWASAWLPHRRVAEHLARGSAAFAAGRLDVAIDAFRAAEHADPGDPAPAIRRADAWRWIVVQHEDSPAVRERWEEAWEVAIGRNRASASLWSGRAEHRLHFFQRWGERDDLLKAREDLVQAIAFSRSDVSLAAQLAVIEAALGNQQTAEQWRERAEQLAAAGGHADRQLSVVQILPAEQLGRHVEAGPLRVAASSGLSSDDPPGEPR